MVMRDTGSFHCPEPRFISRGAAEGNKHGQGAMCVYSHAHTQTHTGTNHGRRNRGAGGGAIAPPPIFYQTKKINNDI